MHTKTVLIVGYVAEYASTLIDFFKQKEYHVFVWAQSNQKNDFLLTNTPNIEILSFDTDDLEAVKSQVYGYFQKQKQLDIVINCMTLSDQLKEGKTGLLGLSSTFNTIKSVVPYLIKNKSGRILNLLPLAGFMINGLRELNQSELSGLQTLTSVWARELGKNQITVNTIQTAFFEPAETVETNKVNQVFSENIPSKRFGNSTDLANAIEFLVSEKASYINGISLRLDGGYYC
jgi:3-oxoacyl-[acyl-carrier protein] reductase